MAAKVRDILRRTWIPLALVVVVAALTTVSGQLASRQFAGGPDQPDAGTVADASQSSEARPPDGQGGRDGGRGRGTPAGFGEWWKDETVKDEIGISDEVALRIDAVWQARSRQAQVLFDEWRLERQELNQMARERVASLEQYQAQVTRVSALSAEREKIRNLMLYQIWLELTPEQYKTLDEIRSRSRRGRGGPPR